MNTEPDPHALAAMKFGIGQPVPRKEDPVLVRGEGSYTDDVWIEGEVHLAMVRSPVAHGLIRSIDLEVARAMPGVLGAYAAADLDARGYGGLPNAMPFKNRDGSPMRKPQRPILARDRVRYVGDPVAFVVAETAFQARDAAEAVALEIESLRAVTSAAEAAQAETIVHDDVPGNLILDYHFGESDKVAKAFAEAAHVTRLALTNNRIVVNPIEPRAAVGFYDAAEERFTLYVGCQGVFGFRTTLADTILKVPREKVRVLTDRVGGSFGMKPQVYSEYVCLLHAARELGRPVRWADQRSESFVSDHHGRDLDIDASLALDAEGRFLAVRVNGLANCGAFLTQAAPLFQSSNVGKNLPSVYRTPLIEVAIRCYATNVVPIGAYRGAGRPEGNYIMERLVEQAAFETGRDANDLRRLNHIAPEAIPFTAASGSVYDSGDFATVHARALAAADWDGFEARREESASRGKLRGRGIGQYLEVTAPPENEMGGIRFDPDGGVTIVTGTLDYGQGHATPFAQVLSARLGVPFDAIRLLQGDSDQLVAGGGTGGSKSLMASGAAISEAADLVIDKGKAAAAAALEAGVADIEFAEGRFVIAGTDRAIPIMALAEKLRRGEIAGEGVPDTLDVTHVHKSSPSAYPNGCHVAEVEVDPETGKVTVARYAAVNDFGVVVNPMLVEGQLHGGVVQGIGQALMERTVFDEEGQLVTGSFMDYCLPRAADLPFFSVENHEVRAKTNPLGAKGCGEAGCAGALPSVMNALLDALREVGVREIDMPATPHRVWSAIEAARAGAAWPEIRLLRRGASRPREPWSMRRSPRRLP